ncbi:general secretion pathway protein GspL [Lysobacter sp. TY2-98]|uniref:PilN domain-containing protein n=1 Tax=Lysobacter sp. TY2-98 TaxID=2290922 RepID=UPI000E20933D|nr:PilN domain-containing protein [Lysobacter sp. TY2-98]AXK70936.1 general secretion pathway protein GspL [Lysobacter sp. TY2-98]
MTSVLEGRTRGLARIAARLGPQATSLRGLLAWWGRALAAWLPVRVRRALGVDRGRLLLMPLADGEVRLQLQRDGDMLDFGRLPVLVDAPGDDPLANVLSSAAVDLPRWLVLPATATLVRRLALPGAAADRLRDVVRFELDRQTPFAADEVIYDARLVGRRPDGQLDVELVAAPRVRAEPLLAALGPLAGRLAGVDVLDVDGTPRGVNLLDPAARRHQRDPWQVWNRVLAGVGVIAVGFALVTILDNRRQAADDLERKVRARSGPAKIAAQQREALNELVAGQAFLDKRRAEQPTAIEVLDEVSRRLPDGTYLEKLAMEGDRLTLLGLSNEAPSLVNRLEGSPLWQSPALAGALQPDPATNRDRFTLTAELGRTPAAKKGASR